MIIKNSIFILVFFICLLAASPSSALKVGDKAKDFSLRDNEGKTVSLTQYTKRAKVSVLEVLNTYCQSCIEKTPSINRIAQEYKSRGVQVIAVALGNETSEVRQFAEKTGIHIPILADPDKTIFRLYDIKKVPSFFIIDNSGTIKYRGTSKTFASLEKKLGAELKRRSGSAQAEEEVLETTLLNVREETEPESPFALTAKETMEYLRRAMPEAKSIEEVDTNGEKIYVGNYPKGIKHYARFVAKDILCDVCSDVHFLYTLDQEGVYRSILPIQSLELYGKPIKGTEFLQQFIGKSHHQIFVADENVDTITGATKSSKKIIEGLNETENVFADYVSDVSFDDTSRRKTCFKHQAEIEQALRQYESDQSAPLTVLDLAALKPYFYGEKVPRCPTGGIHQLINFHGKKRVMCTHHGLDPVETPLHRTTYAQAHDLLEEK